MRRAWTVNYLVLFFWTAIVPYTLTVGSCELRGSYISTPHRLCEWSDIGLAESNYSHDPN